MREQFERLIGDFCRLVNLDDAASVANGSAIEVEEVVFSFIHNMEADQDSLFLCVDFGFPPEEKEATVYYELLKRNFMAFAGKGQTYTISPLNGHVVYVERFPVEGTTGEMLAQASTDLMAEARNWRETRFLSGPYMLRPVDDGDALQGYAAMTRT